MFLSANFAKACSRSVSQARSTGWELKWYTKVPSFGCRATKVRLGVIPDEKSVMEAIEFVFALSLLLIINLVDSVDN